MESTRAKHKTHRNLNSHDKGLVAKMVAELYRNGAAWSAISAAVGHKHGISFSSGSIQRVLESQKILPRTAGRGKKKAQTLPQVAPTPVGMPPVVAASARNAATKAPDMPARPGLKGYLRLSQEIMRRIGVDRANVWADGRIELLMDDDA